MVNRSRLNSYIVMYASFCVQVFIIYTLYRTSNSMFREEIKFHFFRTFFKKIFKGKKKYEIFSVSMNCIWVETHTSSDLHWLTFDCEVLHEFTIEDLKLKFFFNAFNFLWKFKKTIDFSTSLFTQDQHYINLFNLGFMIL